MKRYYLAIDIGASSGRHILGHMEDGKMVLEEIYRFPNGMQKRDGEKVWDIEALFEAVLAGMKKCRELGKIPVSVGIDTWAVDFVLLDKDDQRIGNAVAYRDDRTKGMDEEVYRTVPEEELYASTGIQKQIFNSIYQLMAWKKKKPEQLEKAETLLMIPDYLNFLLSGVKAQEYTNATTTQLVNPETGDWNREMIQKLGYPEKIFLPIREPGTVIGHLKKEIREQVGFDCEIVLPATHDTGSAVVAVPSNEEHVLYISSGTWSLMGTELKEADCGTEAMQHNFTNEGGYNRKYRFLKNIMGLWMVQSVKKEIAEDLSFGTICEMASKCTIQSIVDANDDRFLAPENMTLIQSDLFENAGKYLMEQSVDIVVSNPPYICTEVIDSLSEEVRLHDPVLALDGHEDGLYFYRKITKQAKSFLKPGGRLFYEIGYDQSAAVEALLCKEGYTQVSTVKDLAGLDRVVMGRL